MELQDDFRLCTTRIHGKAAHMGFSLLQFGRIDGMNEHGLCITMSAGCPLVQPVEEGCRFWAVVRTVLDRCHSVPEALEIIQSIPISFHLNLLLTDKHGESALIEMFSSKRAIKRIGPIPKNKLSGLPTITIFPKWLPMIKDGCGCRWPAIKKSHRLSRAPAYP